MATDILDASARGRLWLQVGAVLQGEREYV